MGDFFSTVSIITVTTPLAMIGILIAFFGLLFKDSRGAALVLGAACIGILVFNYMSFQNKMEGAISEFEEISEKQKQQSAESLQERQQLEADLEHKREMARQEREQREADAEYERQEAQQRREDERNLRQLTDE